MAIPARRRVADIVAFAFASMATAFGLFWLFWILWTTLAQGAAALTPSLFTQMTPPPGSSGGLLNAFYGSGVMILLGLLIGAIFLGLGRALGETMAVTFVIGNSHELTASLLMPGNSIAAALANEFTEADTDLYRSSLIALAFLLFVVTFIILSIAKLMLLRIERMSGRTN